MAIPSFQAIMLPLLKYICDQQEHSMREIYDALAEELRVDGAERIQRYKSGNECIFNNRVRWAITHLRKARLLENSRRGFLKITQRGLQMLSGNPPQINEKSLRQFPEYLTFKESKNTNRDIDSLGIKDMVDATSHEPVNSIVGDVVIPADNEFEEATNKEPRAHTEMQWILLKLGSEMGLDVWVARNDRGREINGCKYTDLPRLKSELPLQFDEATNKTIELIDVLWLQGNAILAAFEIESTTSIYSGLLRMSDLIAMQPNLNIPLYLVAPEERRSKVITEVNRPTFSRLKPPMSKMCRYLSFSALRQQIEQAGDLVRFLKSDFLQSISESCEFMRK